ncbi:LTA synthase family protein [Stenotrophomonas koreensis]|uniref:LTA synthase family protein n=1 Tax=Stenotrophomonas koreensis TaxID=266128 RepID=UPI003398A0C4
MLPSSQAQGNEPRQRHWLLRALLVLLGAQLSLSLLAAWTGPALAGQQQVVTLELLGIALWQGLWVLLRSLPLLLLLLWPLLRVLGPRRRWWAFASVGTLWLLLQAALELFFQQAGNPLGADLFGYSWQEVTTTLAGAQVDRLPGLTLLLWLLPCLLLWLGLLWALRDTPGGSAPRRRATLGAVLGASLLAWLVPLSAGLTWLPEQALREQACNKLAWFAADLWRWQQRSLLPVAQAQAQAGPVDADSAGRDPQHPFVRAERTPDVLGTHFAATSDGRAPNIVLILVEGLGRSFSGPEAPLGSFTPFLDELATQSLYFDNFLANQGRTFAVLPSLLGSLPLAEEGFSALPAPLPEHPGLYRLLGGQGYQGVFYNGTDTAFDNERGYLQSQGVERIIDLTNFGPGYERNPYSQWGYPDAELVSRVIADLPQLQPPFVLGMQTISMHTSYRFPGQAHWRQRLDGHLRQLRLPASRQQAVQAQADIYSTILYTDGQLQRFFAAARQQPWHANTIYLITGDHRLPEIPIGEHIERYHVPLLIHSPLLRQPARIGGVSSHLDVLPSLMALLSARYGLQRPAQTPWLGRGLDLSPEFSSTGHFPFKQTKTSAEEYLDGRWWLRDGQLYALEKGMRLTAMDDPAARAQVQARLDAYQRGNHALLQHHRLMAAPSPLQAYDPAQVEQRPEPVPASQALPGLGVEDVSLQPGPATVRLQATFINGDATPSAWFVPLAVLVDEQGNERGEVSGPALQLPARQRQRVHLVLPLPPGAAGSWSVSVRPSDPQTGRANGRGRYRLALELPVPTPEKAP